MKQETNRVIETQEIGTVPDYVKLSEQLQKDMLVAAEHIRNALYDNPEMKTLEIALIALDFPQFIPIENTLDALYEELERLRDELFNCELFDEEFYRIDNQVDNVIEEISRRENPVDTPNATHEDAMARYHELYNNGTYTDFRDTAFLHNVNMGHYDTIDLCNLLTDSAIEICHIVLGADVPDYYQNKTGKLGHLLSQHAGSVIAYKARLHLFNFASRKLVDARYYDAKQDGE